MCARSPNAGRRPRVLVAEDNDELREVLVELLEEEGFDPVPVADGGAARARLDAGEAFDVLLLDDEMPVVRGLDLVKWLRSFGRTTPVVIASGTLVMSDAERERLGIAAVLAKPVRLSELVGALHRALEPRP